MRDLQVAQKRTGEGTGQKRTEQVQNRTGQEESISEVEEEEKCKKTAGPEPERRDSLAGLLHPAKF